MYPNLYLKISCIIFFCASLMQAQEVPEHRIFLSPVKHQVRLAGTFGELRSNHFHMGIDIKSSKGSSGDTIFAVDRGFVSRIKVSRTGYGNALYIDHPSGYTSVYGHLKSFNEKISNLVRQIQKEQQSFEIDIDLDSSQLIIQGGQEIALMGNSGRSYGPHLHFEIRETKSEVPINPMHFGIKPIDQNAPIIGSIKLYELNDKIEEVNEKILSLKRSKNNNYTIRNDTIRIGAWRTAIGIQSYDPMNNGNNKNGIYQIRMKVDGELAYSIDFDSITFDDSRYINAHIDYPKFKQTKTRYHRCFRLPGNKLPNIYQTDEAIIKLYKDKAREIEITVSDYENNRSTLRFFALRDERMNAIKPSVFNYILPYDEANMITQNNLKMFFPEGTLYEKTYLYLNVNPEKSENYLDNVYHIGDPDIPLHRYIKLFIKDVDVDSLLKSKVCWVRCGGNNKITSYGGSWEENHFTARINQFGDYTLMLDTLGPVVKPNFKSVDFSTSSSIAFTIYDNFETSGDANGISYKAYLDGEWIMFDYDLKKDRITHYFEDAPSFQEHELVLELTDDRGNKTILTKNIKR